MAASCFCQVQRDLLFTCCSLGSSAFLFLLTVFLAIARHAQVPHPHGGQQRRWEVDHIMAMGLFQRPLGWWSGATNRIQPSRTVLNRITVRFRCSVRSPIRVIWVVFRASLFGFRLCGGATRVLLPLPCTELTFHLSSFSLSLSVVLLTKRVTRQRTAPRAAAIQSNINKNKVKRMRTRRLRARARPSHGLWLAIL